MDTFANHVAKYAKYSPDEMLEALTRDAMTFSTPQMMLATFSILHVKLGKQQSDCINDLRKSIEAIDSSDKATQVLVIRLTIVALVMGGLQVVAAVVAIIVTLCQ